MTTAPPELPGWVAPGAPVVEINHARSTRAVIVRITATGLVRLDNGSSYRLAPRGLALHKTGEKGPWFGNHRPTELRSAQAHLRMGSSAAVSTALHRIAQLDRFAQDPHAVLAQMQAAVDDARARIAALESETAAASNAAAV